MRRVEWCKLSIGARDMILTPFDASHAKIIWDAIIEFGILLIITAVQNNLGGMYNLSMLRLCFDRLKFPSKLSDFIISLFTSRKNRILTPFGKTESYNLLIVIIISQFPYIWSSGIPANILNINNNVDVAVPITQLTYMDDSTLIASSLSGLEQLLSIARDFYFLNNITANFLKYKLVSSSAVNNLISFHLTSEIPNHLSSMSFSLQALKLSSSFQFSGVWFNLQGSPNFVLSQLKDIYSSFVASIRFKKLSPAQLAYLHSLVVLPKVQFRSQVLYLSEAQVMRIANGYYGLQRKALSVARTFPSIALTSRFFSKDSNPYDSLCERLICRFLSWISFLSTNSKQANWVLIMLQTLQLTLKCPTSLDSLIDFSLWTLKRRSINHNWGFKLSNYFENLDFTVLEIRSWLKSALWCLSQVVDLFYNFRYTWNDLKLMGLVTSTGKISSWFQIITSFPNPISYLPKRIEPINITPSLLSLVGKFIDTMDTSSYIRLRNKYYWIA
ncbi:hypothetical protein RhiirA5_405582 [Rhizophagus irregularis]|uniref:Reverse transcriptase domain-containing protein n=1 Tax=Rhizophagus irregularis TaxID=588596 RepID=A0A2N0QF75_9GLOM|nr:hypothetical protein RhiirA5_405582 [Rhizophagus irregularis]